MRYGKLGEHFIAERFNLREELLSPYFHNHVQSMVEVFLHDRVGETQFVHSYLYTLRHRPSGPGAPTHEPPVLQP
jgi:hypothetical protein